MWFSRIEQRLDKIEQKQGDQAKEQGKTNEHLATYNAQLQMHMKRTELLENRLDSIWAKALVALTIIAGVLNLVKSLF